MSIFSATPRRFRLRYRIPKFLTLVLSLASVLTVRADEAQRQPVFIARGLQNEASGFASTHHAISPDEKWIAIADFQNVVHIYRLPHGEEVAAWKQERAVGQLAVSPDSRYLLIAGSQVKAIEVATGRSVAQIDGSAPIAISQDGKMLAATLRANEGLRVQLWSLPDFHLVTSSDPPLDYVGALYFNRQGNRLLVGSGKEYGKLEQILQLSVPALAVGERTALPEGVEKIEVHGSSLLGRTAQRITVSNIESGKKLFEITNPKPEEYWPITVALSRDGHYLLHSSMSEDTVHRIGLGTGSERLLKLPPKPELKVRSFSVMEALSGSLFLTSEGSDYQLVDGNSGSVVSQMRSLSMFGRRMSIDRQGKYLVVAGSPYDGVRVWDIKRGQIVEQPSSTPFAEGGAISAQGDTLAISSSAGIDVYAPESGLLRSHLNAQAQYLSLSPDGSTLATSADGSPTTLWSVAGRLALQQFESPEYFNPIPAFTSDGRWVADFGNAQAGGLPGTKPFNSIARSISEFEITIHEVKTGIVVKSFRLPAKPHDSLQSEVLAFSSDNAYLMAASGDELHIWNAKDWTALPSIHLPGNVNALSASPLDPKVVATATANGRLGLWNILSREQTSEFPNPDPDIRALAFGPNGNWLVTLPLNGEIQFWDTQRAKLLSNLFFFRNSLDWILATPDGRVDGSLGGLRGVYAQTPRTFETRPLPPSQHVVGLFAQLFPSAGESHAETQAGAAPASTAERQIPGTAGAAKVQFPQLELQTGNAKAIASVIWGPKKQWVASLSDDGFIRLWDASTGHQLRSSAVSGRSAIGSHDGKWIAISSAQGVQIWDVAKWEPGGLLPPDSSYVLAFSADSSQVLTATPNGDLYLWDTGTWRQVEKISPPDHASGMSAVGLEDGFAVALGRTECKFEKTGAHCSSSGVRISHLDKKGSPSDWLKLADNQTLVSLKRGSGTGTLLALSNHGSLYIVDTGDRRIVQTLNLSKGDDSLRMAVTADGRFVLLMEPFQFSIWDLTKPNSALVSRPTEEVCCQIRGADFAEDGTLAAGLETDLAIVDITPELKLQRRFHGLTDTIASISFSDDSHWLASGLSDSGFREGPSFDDDTVRKHAAVRLWSLRRADANVYRVQTHTANSSFVGFLPHSDSLLFGDGNVFMKSGEQSEPAILYKPEGFGLWQGATADSSSSFFGLRGFGGGRTRIASSAANSACDLPSPNSAGLSEDDLAVNGRYAAASDQKAGAPDESVIGIFRPQDCAKLGELIWQRNPFRNVMRLAFAPDGTFLVAGGSLGVVRWSEKQWLEAPKPVEGMLGSSTADPEVLDNTVFPSALALDRSGTLLAYGEDNINVFDLIRKKIRLRFSRRTDRIQALAFSPDDRWIAAGGAAGSITLWEVQTGQLRATLVPIRESNDWLAVTPDGLFDGTPAAWKSILWRFSNDSFDVSPVEIFFRDFYRPGLLQEILAGGKPAARVDLAKVDRRQPAVAFESGGSSDVVETATLRLQLRVRQGAAQAGNPGTGVRDVRVFRNGSLTKLWKGDIQLDPSGSAVLTADLPMAAGPNVFTAFAYTSGNIRSSETAASTFAATGSEKLRSPSSAWIVAVGVDRYSDPHLSPLRYAAADAKDFSSNLGIAQKALGTFQQVNTLDLADDFADRENVLSVLRRLGGDGGANPRLPAGSPQLQPAGLYDSVFLYLAGHGTSNGDRFYFLPRDAKLDLNAQRIETGISDVDLAEAIQNISAKSFVLVIDACESGSAVGDANQRIGMTNSAGLAQLAFDKGIDVLTAGTAFQLASEINSLGHGVLTYSLSDEGLHANSADNNPRDGIIDVGEWFSYAIQEVPRLVARSANSNASSTSRIVQTPRAYYRRDEQSLPPVAKLAASDSKSIGHP